MLRMVPLPGAGKKKKLSYILFLFQCRSGSLNRRHPLDAPRRRTVFVRPLARVVAGAEAALKYAV
jgi:hypothetical protein